MKAGDLVFNKKRRTIVRFSESMNPDDYLDLQDSEDPAVKWIIGKWRNRWEGQTVVCLASGSCTTQEQLDYIKAKQSTGECKIIAVNRSYDQAPFADILYAKDAPWWEGYAGKWDGFKGEKWAGCVETARKYGLSYAEHEIGSKEHTLGINRLRDDNSGHQAINLAYLFGAAKIILVGYEMNPEVEKIHFFGLHDESKGLENPSHEIFKGWHWKMNALAESMDIPVLNCSINTAITGFKLSKLEEAFEL